MFARSSQKVESALTSHAQRSRMPTVTQSQQPSATEIFAENAALKELLEVYESTSVETAQKLGKALDALAEQSQRLIDAEREKSRLAEAQAKRLERELEIAAQLQTSMFPRRFEVDGYDVAATMVPAEQVGGDYFDIVPTKDGCWFGIGDVSGHGLTAGLIMLMTQCAVTALVRREPHISPTDAVVVVNHMLFENIRQRLRQNDHMTLTLLHLDARGVLRFAGAHEELMILRGGSSKVEHVKTPGTWVGGKASIQDVTNDSQVQLDVGDTLVLYSDGIIESRLPESREEWGVDRLAQVVVENRKKSCADLCVDVMRAVEAWSPVAADDRTLAVIRRRA
jgi:sigma-B regulation protein RsbU (phosphoserine phosphatase)